MIKKLLVTILFFGCFTLHSQKKADINSFKYVIVPAKFDFLKERDQYQTSSLTKFLFKKSGFETFLSDESFPVDLSKNRCLALTGNVQRESSFLSTKIYIELLDCQNNIIYKTDIAKTREKTFEKAYRMVIRKAFEPIYKLNYKYVPNEGDYLVEKNDNIDKKEKKTAVIEKKEELSKTEASLRLLEPIQNGFSLISDKTGEIFNLIKTTVKDTYILKDKNGIFYKKAENWIAEYYDKENVLIKKRYSVKF